MVTPWSPSFNGVMCSSAEIKLLKISGQNHTKENLHVYFITIRKMLYKILVHFLFLYFYHSNLNLYFYSSKSRIICLT